MLLKKFSSEGVFGELTRIEFRLGNSANVIGGKFFSSDVELAGGGVLFEHGIHGLDLAIYIAGAKSAQLDCVNTVIEKGFDVHAEGNVTLTNDSGEFDLDFKVSWLSETVPRILSNWTMRRRTLRNAERGWQQPLFFLESAA